MNRFPFLKFNGKIMKYTILLTISLIIFLSCSSVLLSSESAEEYTEVRIYYIGWNILTRSPLSLSDVRRMGHITTTISNHHEINNFIKWGHFFELKACKKNIIRGPRLVVDIYSNSGKRTTFYANPSFLYSEDSTKRIPINKEFRNKFHFGPDPFDILRSRTKPD